MQFKKAKLAYDTSNELHHDDDDDKQLNNSSSWQEITFALRCILSLLTCFMNNETDGIIVISNDKNDDTIHTNTNANASTNMLIKFILLNPSVYFKDIVDNARSVILLGGTMKPFTYVKSFLFPSLPSDNLKVFSCGHVVSGANISAYVLPNGKDGVSFDFRHSNRLSKPLVESLKSTIK